MDLTQDETNNNKITWIFCSKLGLDSQTNGTLWEITQLTRDIITKKNIWTTR